MTQPVQNACSTRVNLLCLIGAAKYLQAENTWHHLVHASKAPIEVYFLCSCLAVNIACKLFGVCAVCAPSERPDLQMLLVLAGIAVRPTVGVGFAHWEVEQRACVAASCALLCRSLVWMQHVLLWLHSRCRCVASDQRTAASL